MAEAILYGVTQTIIERLGSSTLQQIGSIWGVKAEFKKMTNTISTIQAVLQDAEEQQVNNCQVRDWLMKLRDAIFDADDLLSDFSTHVLRQRVMGGDKMPNKGRSLETPVVIRGRGQTHSYVPEEEVIGREKDKEAIIDLLLDFDLEENVSFISIVGIGGLGKTTLAQYVYNDEKVKTYFELKMWVCVSDVFDELNKLDLRGKLEITNLAWVKDATSETKAANLKEKKHLTDLICLVWSTCQTGNITDEISASLASSSTTFFPSLESLYLSDCPNLKGWWKRDIVDNSDVGTASTCQQHISLPSFPRLSRLIISNCYNGDDDEYGRDFFTSLLLLPSSLQIKASECPSFMTLPEWLGNLTSLQNLDIEECPNLTSLPEGMRHLSSLQRPQNLPLSPFRAKMPEGNWRGLAQDCSRPKIYQ
uniref:Rx N-terminal domain-containing protein n=1 Tax=Fagus sylvatica TaxID=28930 RepID=A0A2N9FAT9_FAGSY